MFNEARMSKLMPVIFVSHGAPALLIDGTEAEQFFRTVTDRVDKMCTMNSATE